MRHLIFLAFGLASCTARSQRPLPYQVAADTARSPGSLRLHDLSLKALGLPPLRLAILPDEYRELRVSFGHGMMLGAEYPMVRIVATDIDTVGLLLAYRYRSPDASQRGDTGGWSARALRPQEVPPWPALLRLVDSLGIDTMDVTPAPDSSSRRTWVSHSPHLVVEWRRGSFYRYFELVGPGPLHPRSIRVIADSFLAALRRARAQ